MSGGEGPHVCFFYRSQRTSRDCSSASTSSLCFLWLYFCFETESPTGMDLDKWARLGGQRDPGTWLSPQTSARGLQAHDTMPSSFHLCSEGTALSFSCLQEGHSTNRVSHPGPHKYLLFSTVTSLTWIKVVGKMPCRKQN